MSYRVGSMLARGRGAPSPQRRGSSWPFLRPRGRPAHAQGRVGTREIRGAHRAVRPGASPRRWDSGPVSAFVSRGTFTDGGVGTAPGTQTSRSPPVAPAASCAPGRAESCHPSGPQRRNLGARCVGAGRRFLALEVLSRLLESGAAWDLPAPRTCHVAGTTGPDPGRLPHPASDPRKGRGVCGARDIGPGRPVRGPRSGRRPGERSRGARGRPARGAPAPRPSARPIPRRDPAPAAPPAPPPPGLAPPSPDPRPPPGPRPFPGGGARSVCGAPTPESSGSRDASPAPGPGGARRREDPAAGSAWACLGLFRAGLVPRRPRRAGHRGSLAAEPRGAGGWRPARPARRVQGRAQVNACVLGRRGSSWRRRPELERGL